MHNPKFNFATLNDRVQDLIQTSLEEAIEEQVQARLKAERVQDATVALNVEQMGTLVKSAFQMGVDAMRESLPSYIEVDIDIESHCGRFRFEECNYEVDLAETIRYTDRPEFDIDSAMELVADVLEIDTDLLEPSHQTDSEQANS